MIKNQAFERREATPAQRAAQKVFREIEGKKAMTEHDKAQQAFHKNRERLKAERLARESETAGQSSRTPRSA